MFTLKPTRKSSFNDLTQDIEMQEDQFNDSLLLSPNEPLLKLKAPSFGTDSEGHSEEEHDKMYIHSEDHISGNSHPHTELTFRQIDYLWLFDPFLNFKARTDFRLDDTYLTIQDYEQMRNINRTLLTQFLIDVPECKMDMAARRFSEITEIEEFQFEQKWADECIDEEIKQILEKKANGEYLTVDLTAHIDYFYNTLDCHFKTANPLHLPQKYTALLYQVNQSHSNGSSPVKAGTPEGKCTLLTKHQQVIYPCMINNTNLGTSKQSSTNDGSDQVVTHQLPKKYVWYPNVQIESPVKTKHAESPAPKTVSSYFRLKTVIIRNDPMTPQSQINRAGGFTRKAGNKTDTFGQVSSAVKNSATKRPSGSVREGGLFGAPTPKMLTGTGKKSVLLDDDDFESMTFI